MAGTASAVFDTIMKYNDSTKAPGGVNVVTNPGDNSFLLNIIQQMQAQSSPDAVNKMVQGIFQQGLQGSMPDLLNSTNKVGVRPQSSTTTQQLQDDLMVKLTSAASSAVQNQQANLATAATNYGNNTKTQNVVQTKPGQGALGCYITTAVCHEFNLPDDCEELQVLRKWRDEVLAKLDGGKILIQAYYNQAPKLLEKLGDGDIADTFLKGLRDMYILPAVEAIKEQNNPKAFLLYVAMVDEVMVVTKAKF